MYRLFDQVGFIINQYVPELYRCKIFKDSHIICIKEDYLTLRTPECVEDFEIFENLKKIIITMNLYTQNSSAVQNIGSLFPSVSIEINNNNSNSTNNNNNNYNTNVTCIGYDAQAISSSVLNCATAIGSGAIVSQSNSLVLGGPHDCVGIKTSKPQSSLHVNSGITYKIRTTTKNINLTLDDYIVVVISGSPTLKLPDPWNIPGNGQTFIIKNNGQGVVTVTSTGDETDFALDTFVETVSSIKIESGQSRTFSNIKKTYFIVQH